MQYRTTAAIAALATTTMAQRPANMSICDYYTTALLKDNTAANQYTLLTLVVNTAVIGNYTQPNVGIAVPGILAPGTYMGQKVNLLPYFDGALYSTNSDTDEGTAIAVNFLDGGGAAPLMKNMPADNTSSAQYILLTHLYSYFGALLGCSTYGTADFPSYKGRGSQYNVHRFMDLSAAEVGYFIEQVGLSAASFGVATADVDAVGTSLGKIFDVRCAPATTVIPAQGPQLQSICTADDCPLAANATCSAYQTAMEPIVANATLADGEGRNVSSSASMSLSSAMSSASMASSMASTESSMTYPTSAAVAGASSLSASASEMSMPASSAVESASMAASSAASGTGVGATESATMTTTGVIAPYTGAASKDNVVAKLGAIVGAVAVGVLAL